MITILEDCSPYYVKFTHTGIDAVIQYCTNMLPAIISTGPFVHQKFDGADLLKLLPYFEKFNFQTNRVALFASRPGYRHFVHIDRAAISFNYSIKILDDKCKSNWYKTSDIENNFIPVRCSPYNRAIVPVDVFDKKRQQPAKTLVQQPGECVLFNSDLYHDFDNSESCNERIILTLRLSDRVEFNDAKKILFEL